MSDEAVALRYARAVFELGVESNQLRPLTDQVQKIAEVYADSAELRSVLDNPLVEDKKRAEVLAALAARLGLTQLAINTVRVLAARRRLHALPDIARRLGRLTDEKSGIARATVTSAAPLPDSYYERLAAELEALTKKKIVIEKKQDPSLLGGVVTRIGDFTIDGSLKGRLERFGQQLGTTS